MFRLNGSRRETQRTIINSGNSNPLWGFWSSSLRKNRREEVTLCGLRIGHTYETHGYLLRGKETLMSPLSRASVCGSRLLACPQHSESRARHIGHVPPGSTLRHLLGDDAAWIRIVRLFTCILDTNVPVICSTCLAFNVGYGRIMTLVVPLNSNKQTICYLAHVLP